MVALAGGSADSKQTHLKQERVLGADTLRWNGKPAPSRGEGWGCGTPVGEPHAKHATGGAGAPCRGIDCWESSKWQIMVA